MQGFSYYCTCNNSTCTCNNSTCACNISTCTCNNSTYTCKKGTCTCNNVHVLVMYVCTFTLYIPQNPFKSPKGLVQKVIFHPSRPFFFVAVCNIIYNDLP